MITAKAKAVEPSKDLFNDKRGVGRLCRGRGGLGDDDRVGADSTMGVIGDSCNVRRDSHNSPSASSLNLESLTLG